MGAEGLPRSDGAYPVFCPACTHCCHPRLDSPFQRLSEYFDAFWDVVVSLWDTLSETPVDCPLHLPRLALLSSQVSVARAVLRAAFSAELDLVPSPAATALARTLPQSNALRRSRADADVDDDDVSLGADSFRGFGAGDAGEAYAGGSADGILELNVGGGACRRVVSLVPICTHHVKVTFLFFSFFFFFFFGFR